MILDAVIPDAEVSVAHFPLSRSLRSCRTPRRIGVVAALALAIPLAAATPAMAQPSSGGLQSYVALGDSYTSGPLIPVQRGLPPGCLRSNRNYPSLIAQTFGVPDFRDVSCNGATTTDLSDPQRVTLGVNPPQFDALDEDVELVSLGIGGNDIGFGQIINNCAKRSPRKPAGAACQDFYTSGGTDQLAERIDATAPKIAAALAEIERRSPDAQVLLVGYPAILPDEGPGCFPLVPFSPGDVAYLRDTEKRLNAMLADEADDADADYVDTYDPTIGHDICQRPGRRWIEGLVPTSPAAPLHPNALGMTAIAGAVGEVLVDEVGLTPAA
ncbi:MAG: SGNH/GDSL hydrolase family protein [Pseudonocardia sp.]